ncbi:branched-chain amino acid ABC transporter permease [Pseudarthrobacter sp. HLT3-5]|uniref:branched-chain amino acid ABC transporter permease n=1 Tax=Pseudarthrobacter cellobiosi TaxID=2953654 RepID=UPI00208FC453|nr:branched-chain amino acid ABC transporter permease [Pseudarthrobacter sp. HLT3-5]MCO4275917.1 branched-chain amino acid ABC transporter permease [Pseudarthrobacter sp. HLT3-5]
MKPLSPSFPAIVVRSGRDHKTWAVLLAAAVVTLVAMPYVAHTGTTSSFVMFFVLLIMASMWNLLAGFGGMVSIGQQAYVGIGAYSVLAFANMGVQPFLALPLAALTCAVFAIPTSWLAFRLRGDYFAVGTWVIAEVYRLIVIRFADLGGASGKSLPGLRGLDPVFRGALVYWVALALAVLTILGYLLLRGRTGLALTAVRDDDETAAKANGVDVTRSKRLVYLVSAAGCGAAGGLLIIDALSVQPEAIFSVQWSAYMIFIVIVGGIGYLEGPLIGAIVFFVLQQLLAGYGSWYLIILGLIGAAAAIWLPHGIWGKITEKTGVQLFPVTYRLKLSEPTVRPPAESVRK